MNNPDDFPVDEAEQKAWINERRSATGLSWRALANDSGIAQGTLSTWATGTYAGNGQNIAKKVFKFRQMLESQQARATDVASAGLGDTPGYTDTPSSRRIRGLIITAHSGEMTYAATGPGTGKTMTARDYIGCVGNAFMVTMKPTTKSVTAHARRSRPRDGREERQQLGTPDVGADRRHGQRPQMRADRR